jgi:hypothetical protein
MILEVLPTATSLVLVAQSTVCKSLVFNRILVGRSANPLCYTHDTNWMEVFLAETDSVCGLRHLLSRHLESLLNAPEKGSHIPECTWIDLKLSAAYHFLSSTSNSPYCRGVGLCSPNTRISKISPEILANWMSSIPKLAVTAMAKGNYYFVLGYFDSCSRCPGSWNSKLQPTSRPR